MTLRVEVPEGHKWCKYCGGVFPKDTGFGVRKSVNPSTGTVSVYASSRCKSCLSQWSAARYANKVEQEKPQDLDLVAEQINDACFSGEQVVYRHKGRIKWARYGATVPHGADMLGRFNLGTDYRDLRGEFGGVTSVSLWLPYPPSVNHYWGTRGKIRFIGAKGKEFRAATVIAWYALRRQGFGNARLSVEIMVSPPDKRKRDIDNVCKAVLDALAHARAYEDDSQIDRLTIQRTASMKGGGVFVTIAPFQPVDTPAASR